MNTPVEFRPRKGQPPWRLAVELLCDATSNGFAPAPMLVAIWLIETESRRFQRESCPIDYVGMISGELAIAEACFIAASGHWHGSTENYDPDPREFWFLAVAALVDLWRQPGGTARLSWPVDGPNLRDELAAFRAHLVAMNDDEVLAMRKGRIA